MIEIKNLYFSYNKSLPYILNNINLTIEKGVYISILGENGSGKSTFIKLLLNLIKPTRGTIHICAKNIGYVPQTLNNFNNSFPITVAEILNCHKSALKIKDSKCIDKVLSIVNMNNFKNNLIGELSGGQKQKIFIARALMGKPDLLILDEPSTGIDVKSQKDIYSFLRELNKKNNITIISVEHNLQAAIENSTHIFNINKFTNTCLLTIDDYLKTAEEDLNNVRSFSS
ncbi:putative metal transport system ATP-binding protein TP [Clostridium pasteurianum DSM 525 = ATCC 6013]|uniref:Polyamine-transporting ATPase n=1 Tax=Clostridium pasteurianum DSM 525 = ATCC 6013 TaxID=1262449 RepID=A0A0H3J6S5_CLOPA|nr:metal ABC transporter ATP-binding protein [Clostridium pasteurianum]AJA49631.1 putative metal transport system ATP-binding protein TP [Clostridium pasteurianum DSM 525 = ATCC 6013]AJA53619.1 putative metal transport system ATP-binding protein TP [Clostridium pasteurianum DSM 525 = ATCC 6013]AOZ76784.1 metal ABC transporter ATP-binding protein [Clostridium pasteurianum DSM 525 = ATCC 6013]AOZ80581.1 metal ABC transporter ATP-binding protein [Clostridium pasteurianum]ELP58853.1 ABC-type iron 